MDKRKRKSWDLHGIASGLTIIMFAFGWWQRGLACLVVVGAYTVYLWRKDWDAGQKRDLD